MKKYYFLTLLLLSTVGLAANDRQTKIRTLMEAQGLLEMFQNQLEMGKAQNQEMGKKMMAQLMSNINPSSEYKTRFEGAYMDFISDIQAPWSAEEIVTAWGQFYGSKFNDNELEQLISFYTSAIGKKEVTASHSALTDLSLHYQKLAEPIYQKATQDYITTLKLLAKECNCAN